MIDAHLHIGHLGRGLENLIAHIDYHNVERAVVLPLEDKERNAIYTTEVVLDAVAKYPDRIIPFCHVDPRYEKPLERIEAYAKQGCRGFGEHKLKMDVDAPVMREVYALCGELGLPVLLHIEYGGAFNTNFPALEDMLKAYPDTIFIGHAQAWWANISADVPMDVGYPEGEVKPGGFTDRLLTEYPNIYGDLSARSGLNALTRDMEFSRDFVARHRKRLLWATDCPCKDGKGKGYEPGCFAAKSLPVLRELADEETFRDITHNNAAELFDI
jgi:predicted TIM-barrel fold metal-dependent hydrolase